MLEVLDFLKNDVKIDRPANGFVPHACHFDENTILTKNGDLMQIIKITSFNFDNINEDIRDLRSKVRNAIKSQVTERNFLLYFHTLRDRKDLDPAGGKYDNPLSKMIHDEWCKKNFWHDKFVNELYISIIIRGDNPFRIKGFDDFMKSFSFRGLQKKFNKKIQAMSDKLSRTTTNVIDSLGKYGARRLTIKLDEKGAHSEILAFLGKLAYLSDVRGELPIMDLSDYLTNSEIIFGNNMIEVRFKQERKFAAIFTIKEYHEISPQSLDSFLQLPQSFIVTQTFSFVDQKSLVKDYEYSKYILDLTNSQKLIKSSELDSLVDKVPDAKPNDFGIYQLSIMLYADDIQMLQQNISRASTILSSLGMCYVREDLNLEEIFWSQLPGNPHFICRKTPLRTEKIAGFASLHNFPHGTLKSAWGSAITIFRTSTGTPYFFNFHNAENGHCLIIGTNASGRRGLANFLISEATKFNPKIYSISSRKPSEVFYKALGGKVYKAGSAAGQSKISEPFKINPFKMNLFIEENRDLLVAIIISILVADNVSMEEFAEKNILHAIQAAVEKLKIVAFPERDFDWIYAELGEVLSVCPKMQNNLLQWCAKHPFAGIFQGDDLFQDGQVGEEMIRAFDLTAFRSNLKPYGPISIYVVNQFLRLLDGKSHAIMFIDSLMDFTFNHYVASQMKEMLEEFTRKNVIAIFLLEGITRQESIAQIKDLYENSFATRIFTPQSNPPEIYKDAFNFQFDEFEALKSMSILARNFMIKRQSEDIVAELNIAGLPKVINLLCRGNDYHEKIKFAEEAIEEFGDIPENWIPKFMEKINA